MDERMKELIALGAAAAVNCRPCLDYHFQACKTAGASRTDMEQAVETGLQVNRGAAAKTREYFDGIDSGQDGIDSGQEETAAAGCC